MGTIESKRLSLRFASIDDMGLVYQMLTAKEIAHFMFSEAFPAPTWNEFREDEAEYFGGHPSRTGNYLLIEFQSRVIGSICYANWYEKRPFSEMDIWLVGDALGRGFGTEAITRTRDYVHETFGINEFVIRPWKKNENAIRAYQKCGFKEYAGFDASLYYDDALYEEYGEGDYGPDETFTMIMRYEEG